MDFGSILNVASEAGGDPGAYLKRELEEGLEPITKRVDALEKKLDLLILTAAALRLYSRRSSRSLRSSRKYRSSTELLEGPSGPSFGVRGKITVRV